MAHGQEIRFQRTTFLRRTNIYRPIIYADVTYTHWHPQYTVLMVSGF